MCIELCTDEQLRDFYHEFNATEESIKEDVQYLMEWMKQQPHLPNVKDEGWLINFLLRSKNSIERAKKLIESYYTARALMPEIFQNRNLYSKEIEDVLRTTVFLPVPKLTPDGCRIMICRVFEHENNNFPDAECLLKCMQMVFDWSSKVDKVRAVTLVYDFENVTLAYIKAIFSVIKKVITVQSKINPIRYNKIYVLHLASFAQPLVNIGRTLVKKQSERVIVWNRKASDLAEVLPKECLPEEYGGTEKSIKELKDMFVEYVKQFQDTLDYEESIKVDLTKIPHHQRPDSLSYGIEGSFRKLCID